MSQDTEKIQQCCVSSPVWIFIYSDGRIFSICNEDYKSTAYRFDVVEVINMESQISMTAEQAFGDKNGKF